MQIVPIIAGVALLLGLALRRWRLLWVIAALAATHAVWLVLTGQETSEDSTATLLALSAILLYAPALVGGLVGVLLGRAARSPDPLVERRSGRDMRPFDQQSSEGTTMAEETAGGSSCRRQPTSHERRAGESWDASYRDGPAPWDIGQPQPAIVRLAAEGAFSGPVLDAGCGTGENALHVASLGLDVVGVDVAATALSIAREKAAARDIDAGFVACDALHLDRMGRRFETVLDCGLFHTFDRGERREYVASLAAATRGGGRLYVLCFRDAEGETRGPHPVAREELSAAFTPDSGWRIASVSPDRIATRFGAQGLPAWLVDVERT